MDKMSEMIFNSLKKRLNMVLKVAFTENIDLSVPIETPIYLSVIFFMWIPRVDNVIILGEMLCVETRFSVAGEFRKKSLYMAASPPPTRLTCITMQYNRCPDYTSLVYDYTRTPNRLV